MYKFDFLNPVHVHFIGIGGISMFGLAEFLHTKGFQISGSDEKCSARTEHLESLGIKVYYGNRASNITADIDVVVYTAAVRPDNFEFQAAVSAKLPMLTRAELLGQIMLHYNNSIAVSGTHGKTTTTSMLSLMLLEADLDPTILVGGILDNIKGGLRLGGSDYLIAEACEYTNSFLKFFPKHAIILNIEADHLDFFKDLNDIRASFRKFAELLPSDGILTVSGDIPDYKTLFDGLQCKLITFGIEQDTYTGKYDYSALNVTYNDSCFGSYDLYNSNGLILHVELMVSGRHNVLNSLAAFALSDALGAKASLCQKGLSKFRGVERRFEKKGVLGGITFIDDYAHHPSEIRATLTSARNMKVSNIWCVFQPHTYSRTKALLQDFAEALTLADHVILTDIYPAREKDPGDISSRDLRDALLKKGTDVYYFSSFDEIENLILQKCTSNDMLITMGAGDVFKIGNSILGI